MKKITVLIISFVLFSFCNISHAASCLDQGLLGFIQDKNSIGYLENVFPMCAGMNQCGPAMKGLEKLKSVDPIRYAFIKGCALANGDCIKQDLKEAEKQLLSYANYSLTCRNALFNLYSLYTDNPDNYLQFALSLASEGNRMAYSFLADYYSRYNIIHWKDVLLHIYGDISFITPMSLP